MSPARDPWLPRPTLAEALAAYEWDTLQGLARLAEVETPRGWWWPEDVVGAVVSAVRGPRLVSLWERLDGVQKAAVAATLHGAAPMFDPERFRLEHGRLPAWSAPEEEGGAPTPLHFFLPLPGLVPADLEAPLRRLVPPPDPPTLRARDDPPSRVEVPWPDDGRRLDPGRAESGGGDADGRPVLAEKALVVREMEAAALHDLAAVLSLARDRGIRLIDRRTRALSARFRPVAEVLFGGEFYGDEEARRFGMSEPRRAVGYLRAFAWTHLLRAGGLVAPRRRRLRITEEGRRALADAEPWKVLTRLWESWEDDAEFDELWRMPRVRVGARAGVTLPPARRAAVGDALAACPVGRWVAVRDLYLHMRATGRDFRVVEDPSKVYLRRPHFTFDVPGVPYRTILEERYVLAVLFEYAASLGMVDVAYSDPRHARPDFYRLWGSEGLHFLSRWDGLFYVRLTPLGAYLLGLEMEYVRPHRRPAVRLRVLEGGDVMAAAEPPPGDRHLLDLYGERISERRWRFDRARLLASAEAGHPPGELRAFLEAAAGPLPDGLEATLAAVERRAGALRELRRAHVFRCRDASMAAALASDPTTRALCRRAGRRDVVVPERKLDAFRAAARELGWGTTTARSGTPPARPSP